jgi:hypothetical protein
MPQLDVHNIDSRAIRSLCVGPDFTPQTSSDAIRSRPRSHLVRFNELKNVPLSRLGLLASRDNPAGTCDVFGKHSSEVRQIRVILKNDNSLIGLDAYDCETGIPQFLSYHFNGSAGRQRNTKNQMRCESLHNGSAPGLDLYLGDLGEKRFAEYDAFTASGSGCTEA